MNTTDTISLEEIAKRIILESKGQPQQQNSQYLVPQNYQDTTKGQGRTPDIQKVMLCKMRAQEIE